MAETVTDNGVKGTPVISICIPAWKDTATPLLSSLASLACHQQCEVLVYDDGSSDSEITAQIVQNLSLINAPGRLITASTNYGRSHARNRLITHAKADWLLMLDADMLPDEHHFLQRYLDAIADVPTPALIVGGFSLQQVTATPEQRLHAAQSQRSECLPAANRARDPGLYVFTSNILVHRTILDSIHFDEGYTGWGWEDVDWGLRVMDAFPINHIDNTATHLGLDDTMNLLAKYANSKDNFARLVQQHPQKASNMRLYQVSKRLSAIPARKLLGKVTKGLAEDPLGLVPISVRLFALKLFRASIYAETLI